MKVLLFILVFAPVLVFAAEGDFVPLVSIQGIDFSSNTTLVQYINALFTLLISVAAMLAVIRIVTGGFKYMTSEAISAKGEAREDIQGAVLGLLLLLGSWLILFTVNPQILDLSALRFGDLQPSAGTQQSIQEQRERDEEARERAFENVEGSETFSTKSAANDRARACTRAGGVASVSETTETVCRNHCDDRTRYVTTCSRPQ